MSVQLSIITPCLNRAAYIEEAIQSVLRQNYPELEHIIIDGGSTDGTLEILLRYPHLKVISEPDRSMYDALNKGLNLATGDIVGFLNTDDLYADNVFFPVLEQFANPNIQAVAGRARFFSSTDGNALDNTFELSPPVPSRLMDETIIGSTMFNAWFFRKELLVDIGGFDPRFMIAGDADILLRLALNGIRYILLDCVVYAYRQHSGSLTMQLDSQKLLRIWDDHIMFRDAYADRRDVPRVVRRRMNELCANTCSLIAWQYWREKSHVQFATWYYKAALYAPFHVLYATLQKRTVARLLRI